MIRVLLYYNGTAGLFFTLAAALAVAAVLAQDDAPAGGAETTDPREALPFGQSPKLPPRTRAQPFGKRF